MREALTFRFSPEATSDENLLESQPILSLILASVLGTSVGYSPDTKPQLTSQDVMKLVASGLPDSVVLTAVETNDKAFDVSPANLLKLKQAGVSEKVVAAMLERPRRPPRRLPQVILTNIKIGAWLMKRMMR